MFYNHKIHIYKQTKGHTNDLGVWVEGGLDLIETLPSDIQPFTNDLAYQQFGYDGNVSYKVYCPTSNNLTLNGLVKAKDTMYRIVSMKEWDDYTILVLGDKDD